MNNQDKVAVCSRSFSRHPILRREILRLYRHVTFNEQGVNLHGQSLVDFIRGHNKAITALEKIDEIVLSQLPELEVIAKYGVGLDMIDLGAMQRYGKRLGWTPGVNKRSAAELALAFAIITLRQVIAGNREILQGSWRQLTGGQLTGRTVGIIGCGHIGQEFIRLLRPFNCPILVYDIKEYKTFYHKFNIRAVKIEELLCKSDVVSLHVPLDKATRNLLTGKQLSLMKKTAVLINVARGGLVDECDLKEALRSGGLSAAAFDVFAQEPPQDKELLNLPNFLATPHIGGSAEEAILEMGRAAIRNLEN